MGQTLSERMQVNIRRWGVGGFTHSTGGGIRGKCSKFKRENYQKICGGGKGRRTRE